MNRRNWLKSITGAFATLATGLGLRKVEKRNWVRLYRYEMERNWWVVVYSRAYYDGQRWHFEDVKPEDE